jgi:hypothetical protein
VNPPTVLLTYDDARVPLLLGPQGANIKGLQTDSGAHIKVNIDSSAPFATIKVAYAVCV